MIEIIPNWHPIFTHFSIGLLITSSALFLAGSLLHRRPAGARVTTAARWNLGIGVLFAGVTIATGYQAYFSVGHDGPAHAAMTIHLKWAWAAFVLFALAAILGWFDRQRIAGAGLLLSTVLIAATIALSVTGYLGGENVYRHGIGVLRTPEIAGPGHSHSHDESHTASTSNHQHARPDSADGALDAFHHALEEGDGTGALDWLADDAVVLEGGVAQSKTEYARHHLASDMAFLSKISSERLSRTRLSADGATTVVTRTRLVGTIEGREIDTISSETAVLIETTAGWRIQHIHWSN